MIERNAGYNRDMDNPVQRVDTRIVCQTTVDMVCPSIGCGGKAKP